MTQWNQLAAELWTMIAGNCDKDGVRALSSPEMPPHILNSARPVYSRHLTFSAYNILDDIDVSNIVSDRFPNLLTARKERSRQRFLDLPLNINVRHVRSWKYEGILPRPVEPEYDTGEEITRDSIWRQMYHHSLWPLFIANLPRYIGLTKLCLKNVVLDNKSVETVNSLKGLKVLDLSNVEVSHTKTLLHSHDHLTDFIYQQAYSTFCVEFVIGVCSTLTYLEISVSKLHYRELYSVLEQCHALETLSINLEEEENLFERPEEEELLSDEACPKLSKYIGPAYYAPDIITGRPIHWISLNQTLDQAEAYPECIEWILEYFTGSSTALKSFGIPHWPAYACTEDTFPTLFSEFPHLESLRIIIEPFLLTDEVNLRDKTERERYETWHYLNILHILAGPLTNEIPPTLQVLELVTEEKYGKHPFHTFDAVVTALRNSSNFSNLQTLIVGTEECFQTWKRLKSGSWDMTQHGDGFDLDGEDTHYYGITNEDLDDEGSQMDDEDGLWMDV